MLQRVLSILLSRRYQSLLAKQLNPSAAQEEAFLKLKKSLRGTKIFNLTEVSQARDLEEFARLAEVRTYKDYSAWISESISGSKNLMHRDKLCYVGLSSGTTNPQSKSVPYNEGMLKAWKGFQLNIASVVEAASAVKFLRDKRLTWGSTPHLETLGNGIQAGYVSGFLAMRSPSLIQKNTYPKKESLMLTDMPQKMKRMAEELRGVDLRLISAVPSYMVNVFETLKQEWGVENLSHAFPHLHTFVYSATAIHAWKDQINSLVGRELQYLGVYAATEGAFGYEIPEVNGGVNGRYSFHLDDFVLLFKRVGEDGKIVTLRSLKPGDEVELLLSSPNGLINYALGDVLRISSIEPFLTFEVLGRVGQGLNIAAEKVSQQELSQAVEIATKRMNSFTRHFFVRPGQSDSGRPSYTWTIALDEPQAGDASAWAKTLDRALMEVNDDYREARMDLQFIDAPQVNFIHQEVVKNYFRAVAGKGQLKMRTTFTSEESYSEYLCQMMSASA
jgi:hypothetical protein